MRLLSVMLALVVATSAGAATITVNSEKWGDVNFRHRSHVQKARVACGVCHYWDAQNDMATKVGHGPCKGCHIEKNGPVYCRDCHPRRK